MGEMMEESFGEITLKVDLDWQSFQDWVSLVALLHLNPNVNVGEYMFSPHSMSLSHLKQNLNSEFITRPKRKTGDTFPT